MWDTVVVGAGPGGISAAIWAHRLGLRTLVVEAESVAGGQLNALYGVVIDYPGIPVKRGLELAPYFVRHLEQAGVPFRSDTTVLSIDARERQLELAGGECILCRSLIIATGAQRRRLGVPGEETLWGRGLSDSPTRDREGSAGRVVAVVGGGDAALENALLLAEVCPEVFLLHRRDRFRARPEFVARVHRQPNIRPWPGAQVRRILGETSVTGLEIEREGRLEALAVDRVFIKIGVAPRSELVRGQVALDPDGYVAVDRSQETSIPLVFAVGDVCNPVYSSIANAVGQGMIAAKTIEERLRRLP